MTADRATRAALLAAALAIVFWVRMRPLSLPALDDQATLQTRQDVARSVAADIPASLPAGERLAEIRRRVDGWIAANPADYDRRRSDRAAHLKAELSYRGGDGRDHVYLGDYDSYAWLRYARNVLRTGSACDAVVDDVCRDTLANAPVGRRDDYHRSLHVAAIVAVHRLMELFRAGYPLPASAYLVPVLVGVLGVFPAFAIGRRLGGDLAGWGAALLIGCNPIFLQRSLGSDTDVWNLILPLYMIWAGTAAMRAAPLSRRAGNALLAAAFAVLHAATWQGWTFTYAVLLVGMLAHAGVLAVRYLRRQRNLAVWRSRDVRDTVLVAVVFYAATAALAAISGVAASPFAMPAQVLVAGLRAAGLLAAPIAPPSLSWPNALRTVSELGEPDLAAIANYMGGTLAFFVGWLGLLVLTLPRRRWTWGHFVVLIAGNYLYRYLITVGAMRRSTLVLLLALPLLVAVALSALADDDEAHPADGAALTVVLWFVAALFISFSGLRFVMLLVPPFALSAAAAVGRLYEWLRERVAALGSGRSRWLTPLLFAALAAAVLVPVRRGSDAAYRYHPRISAAWGEALAALRDTAPADAIVTTWWDYGYWAKYFAERPVTADGGSLRTHIPHWLGRALLTGDAHQAIGLLRMLDCGSDASPDPEGNDGAIGRLLRHGFGEVDAHAAVLRLARLDRAAARADLVGGGLSADAADDVLDASHCQPPPAYLVLTSEMGRQRAWRLLGGWDPARTNPSPPASASVPLRWYPCQRGASQGAMTCPIGAGVDRAGTGLERVVYEPLRPEATRLQLHRGRRGGTPGEPFELTPALVLLAGDRGIEPVVPSPATAPTLAVLVDAANQRVMVGPPDLLGSTFAQLMYLDGRYAPGFEKVDDRTGFNGERVVTWRIVWGGR